MFHVFLGRLKCNLTAWRSCRVVIRNNYATVFSMCFWLSSKWATLPQGNGRADCRGLSVSPLHLLLCSLLYNDLSHTLSHWPSFSGCEICCGSPHSRQIFHPNQDLLSTPLCSHQCIIHSCFSWMEKGNGRKWWEAGYSQSRAKANNMVQVCLDLAPGPCCVITSVPHLFLSCSLDPSTSFLGRMWNSSHSSFT